MDAFGLETADRLIERWSGTDAALDSLDDLQARPRRRTRNILDDEYRRRVREFVRLRSLTREAFTSDDITVAVGAPPSGSTGVLGAVMSAAVKEFGLVCVGSQPSARPARHRNRVLIWQGRPDN